MQMCFENLQGATHVQAFSQARAMERNGAFDPRTGTLNIQKLKSYLCRQVKPAAAE